MTVWNRNRRDAKRFAKSVQLGKTYYTVEECAQPWGNEPKWHPWVFTNRQAITGAPMCGSMNAEGLVTRYGPVYDTQPKKIRGLFERGPEHRPDPQKVADDERASRPKRPAKTGWW